ncbi:MAG: orotate phosphoribosyltransferase [Oscillospiraceae bacterium]|nr:orotate phosphoribosyltransferase [Oscillospiraceae bacterium]
MDERTVLDILDRSGARLEGHFLLSSGRHGSTYMQCGRVFQHAEYAEKLCRALASRYSGIDAVAGPALGAVIMAYEVSRHLGCRNIFTERENGVMTLRRGFSIRPGERVLVVEDAVTTGGSVREVIEVCRSHGAEVIGVGALVDRTGGVNPFDVPFHALIQVHIPAWTAEECPLCAEGIPCVKPGSRPVPRADE